MKYDSSFSKMIFQIKVKMEKTLKYNVKLEKILSVFLLHSGVYWKKMRVIILCYVS